MTKTLNEILAGLPSPLAVPLPEEIHPLDREAVLNGDLVYVAGLLIRVIRGKTQILDDRFRLAKERLNEENI